MFPSDLTSIIIAILVLILADVLMGICKSAKEDKFDVRELPKFLETKVFPYVGGLGVLFVAAPYNTELKIAFITAAGTLSIKLLAEIKDKIKSLLDIGFE